MDYISTKEAAQKWGIGERRVQYYCSNGKIPGVRSLGKQWIIPSDSTKPSDGRTKNSKSNHEIEPYRFPIFIFSRTYAIKDELEEDDKELLNAQTLYLEGKFYDSIKVCRNLISYTLKDYIKAGVYSTLAYDASMTGLANEYKTNIQKLEKLASSSIAHKEDYLLILAGIKYHFGFDSSYLIDIDIHQLSSDSLDYYQAMMLMKTAIDGKAVSDTALLVLESICIQNNLEAISPLAIMFHALLASLYQKSKKLNQFNFHVEKACEIAIDKNWYSYLAKYYAAILIAVNNYFERKKPGAIEKIHECAAANISAWQMLNKLINKEVPFKGIPLEYYQYLPLLARGLDNKEIATVLNKAPEIVQNDLDFISSIIHTKTRTELVNYAIEKLTSKG